MTRIALAAVALVLAMPLHAQTINVSGPSSQNEGDRSCFLITASAPNAGDTIDPPVNGFTTKWNIWVYLKYGINKNGSFTVKHTKVPPHDDRSKGGVDGKHIHGFYVNMWSTPLVGPPPGNAGVYPNGRSGSWKADDTFSMKYCITSNDDNCRTTNGRRAIKMMAELNETGKGKRKESHNMLLVNEDDTAPWKPEC